MADAIKLFRLIVSAPFPTVDPLTGSPIFLALTSEYPQQTRRALSRRVAVDSFFLMIGTYFIGSHRSWFLRRLVTGRAGGGEGWLSSPWDGRC
jgi:multiple antibiotic resistance protein